MKVAVVGALTLGAIRIWPGASLTATLQARYGSSIAVYDANGGLMRLSTASDERYRLWTQLDDIAPDLIDAFLLHEDQYFYRHPGVNPVALLRGAIRTYALGQPPQGGSTITMQLARLTQRMNTRSIGGKLRQMGHALWLEARYSKRDILAAYLNLAPFGANIEGVGAASIIHFGKRPDALNTPEALTLAVIPQAPTRRNLSRNLAGTEQVGLQAVRTRLAERWREQRSLSSDDARLLALPVHLHAANELPFRAPHVAAALIAQHRPNQPTQIDATIDPTLQALTERMVRSYVRRHERVGINNAAAMLVDTRTMAVRALVGSANFHNSAIAGQVNAATAKRSPGSTLKPFVYALAMDQGVIHPLTVLRDAPSAFGTFTPENFDLGFIGPITAHDALIRSRNVPAVWLAGQINNPSLHGFLKAAGVQRLAEAERYGLALALGAAEVSMEELATLYATLANGGVVKPLRYRANDPISDGTRLLSEEASFMTHQVLRDNPRPEGMRAGARAGLPIGWKTGTSWGFRDAWSAGMFGQYVLIVWVGNFDGSSNAELVGGKTAGPLFFQIADAIQAAQPGLTDPNTDPPAGLIRVDVCAASGDLPNAHCPKTVATWFSPGRSPIRVSDIHRAVAIDIRSGSVACADTDPRFVRNDVYEFWSSEMQRVFHQAGLPRRTPRVTDCGDHSTASEQTAGAAPAITSPLRGAAYALRSGRIEPVALAANADGDVAKLYWFINDSFIQAARPNEPVQWQPRGEGRFTVRVVDERGRADSRILQVSPVR